MKWGCIFLIVFGSFSPVRAHEYFFGFAEIAYNETVYEGTLMLSTHDLQDWLEKRKVISGEWTNYQNDVDQLFIVFAELTKEFQIDIEGKSLNLQILGVDVLKTGMTYFYFQSEETAEAKQLDISFPLMMKEFPKQQNKITVIKGVTSYTAVFLPGKEQAIITIK